VPPGIGRVDRAAECGGLENPKKLLNENKNKKKNKIKTKTYNIP
jgi:hypothetical protein